MFYNNINIFNIIVIVIVIPHHLQPLISTSYAYAAHLLPLYHLH